MSQEIYELQSPEFVAKTIPKLHKSILAALSNLSGSSFPTKNLDVGMFCFRTDTFSLYMLEDVVTKKWTKVIDLRNAFGNADMLDGKHATDFAPSGFGIGTATSKLKDLNIHTGGLFAVDTNCANSPSIDYGFLVAIRLDTTKSFQMFTPLGSTNVALKGMLFVRIGSGADWSKWSSIPSIDSPEFSGTPTAPTPIKSDNSKKIATTEFVQEIFGEFLRMITINVDVALRLRKPNTKYVVGDIINSALLPSWARLTCCVGGQTKADDLTFPETVKVGSIIIDGTAQWVVRHIAHPVVGTIVDWQSSVNMGDGFLKCIGTGVDPNVYPLLKGILPEVSGKLILPDRRGVVPRGLDDGRGLDTGRTIGSYQGDEIKSHYHTTMFRQAGTDSGPDETLHHIRGYDYPLNTNSVGGTETRMKNVATTYWICYA